MYNVSKYFMIASAIFSLICCGGAVWAGIKLNNDSTCYFMALIFLIYSIIEFRINTIIRVVMTLVRS